MKWTIQKRVPSGAWKYVGIARNAKEKVLMLLRLTNNGWDGRAVRLH